MALIIKSLYQAYEKFKTFEDPRTKDYFLYGSPIEMLTILGGYLLFVKKIGPAFMENREPFKLTRIIQIYNLIQIIANALLLIYIIKLMIYVKYSFKCQVSDSTTSATGMYEANTSYYYYLLKLTDLCDTIFFILRKKYRQASFLHIYHHMLMVVGCYFVTKIVPGGHSSVVGLVNTFIHVLLYMYYFITSYKPNAQRSIWWKRHITQLQLLQFGYLFFHYLRPIIFNDCDYPIVISLLGLTQSIIMLCMFSDFYWRSYYKKKSN